MTLFFAVSGAEINIMAFNLNKFGFGSVEQKPTPKEKEWEKIGYVEKKATAQENREIRNLNKSQDIDVQNPYRNPREGIVNIPGSDVVDPANYYNEPGFEKFEDEIETFGNSIDDSKKGGEIGAFMEKYNLEEFELEKLMSDCDAYLNGKKIPAPLKDGHDLKELALLYHDYLKAKNDGAPLSEKPAEPDYKKVLLKSDPEREKRIQDAKNNDPKLWKDVPKYSEEDLALRKRVLAYITQEEGAKKPAFEGSEKFTKEQIEDVLREIAEDEKWPQANFFEEVRRFKDRSGREENRRQLATVQNLENGKRVKYTFMSDNLPTGKYFYQADPKAIFISKNNPNSAFVPIRLFIGAEKRKKNVPEDIAARLAEVAASKAPEIAVEPKPVIIKKEKPQEKPAPTLIKKGTPVEKPKAVIKKRVPEEVM